EIISGDDFTTHNQFHGGDLGIRAWFNWDSLALCLLAKGAVGPLRREVNIGGGQVTTVPGAADVAFPAGVYALTSNGGLHTSGEWTVMPEFGAHLYWQATGNVR